MARTWNERNHYTLRYQRRQFYYYNNWHNSHDDLSPKVKGRLRKHSYKDCGVSRCPLCDNPRRLHTYSGNEKITMQERKANESEKYFSNFDPFDNTDGLE